MGKIIVVSNEQAKKILTMSAAIDGVTKAYMQKSSRQAEIFPMVYKEFSEGRSDFDIRSGCLKDSEIYGLKMVSWFADNVSKNLPVLHGTILIADLNTGEPKGILASGVITDMRTGAAGAVGAKYLARKDSKSMLMVGTGVLAAYEIAAVLCAIKTIDTVYIINPHHPEKTKQCLPEIQSEVEEILSKETGTFSYVIKAEEDMEYVVGKSDVIITATPARTPLIRREWLKPGTHISCVGADMPGKQELDEEILAEAKIFVDDVEQSVSAGECEAAYKKKLIQKERLVVLGDVINQFTAGRKEQDEITVFDTSGIALQDLIVGEMVLKAAKKNAMGTVCEL